MIIFSKRKILNRKGIGSVLLLCALLGGVGCSNRASSNPSLSKDYRKESYVNGIVYQLSAEVKALQLQAFALARIRLDNRLEGRRNGLFSKPIAIISDIDATLIDDAPYMCDIIQREGGWDNGPWNYYYDAVASSACEAIPGALEFMQYAHSQQVEIFYITNRDWDKKDLTVAQLKRLGFPNADRDHVQVMNEEGSSNKTERRNKVLNNYEVVLYLGDNIGDFTADFLRELGAIERTKMATNDPYKNLWGNRFIVLPNATYGDYVGAVWFNDKKATASKRVEAIKTLFNHYRFTNSELYQSYQ